MPPKTAATPQPNMGRKIERIRTIKGIKQDTLAKQLGISTSTLSRLEQSQTIEDDKLQQLADALEMSVEAIKNFNEESVLNYVENNYGSIGSYPVNNFNPLEKYIEVVEENKKLYERMLADRDRLIVVLEGLVKK